MVFASCFLLDGSIPADPFIAGERSEALPF